MLIHLEIALALWLVSGYQRSTALAASLVFFVGASLKNCYSIYIGASSCGCFGSLQVSPKLTLALNLALIVAITYVLPALKIQNLRMVRKWDAVVVVCIAIFGITSTTKFLQAYYRPSMLTVPSVIDVGTLELDQQVDVVVPVKNLSNRPLKVWGAKSTCTCVQVQNVPFVIAGDASNDLRLVVKPLNLRNINVKTYLYIDSGYSDAVITLKASVASPKR